MKKSEENIKKILPHFRIGICGASGVGKTTLAKIISEELDIPFIAGSARMSLLEEDVELLKGIRKEGNYWSNKDHLDNILYSLVDPQFGLMLQGLILKRRQTCFKGKTNFVTDRTPIDNLTYFMMQNSVVLDQTTTNDYIDKCIEVLNKHFDFIIFIRTEGMEDVEIDGHRVANLEYQHMIDNLFEYIIGRYIKHHVKGIGILNIGTRDINVRRKLIKQFFDPLDTSK